MMENSRFEFRVWDNIHEIMMKLSEVNTYSTIDIISNVFKESLNVMQYTGLLDKNGVKIFEGDILFYHSSRKSGNVVVECVMGTFGFDCIDKTQGWQLLGLYNQFCEVIGNKFENPELLEKTNERKRGRVYH